VPTDGEPELGPSLRCGPSGPRQRPVRRSYRRGPSRSGPAFVAHGRSRAAPTYIVRPGAGVVRAIPGLAGTPTDVARTTGSRRSPIQHVELPVPRAGTTGPLRHPTVPAHYCRRPRSSMPACGGLRTPEEDALAACRLGMATGVRQITQVPTAAARPRSCPSGWTWARRAWATPGGSRHRGGRWPWPPPADAHDPGRGFLWSGPGVGASAGAEARPARRRPVGGRRRRWRCAGSIRVSRGRCR
jgi:hypothetical protein